jgi:hypothetical protein
MRSVQNPAHSAAAWGSPAQRLPCGLQSLLVGISVLSPALSQPQCSLHVQPTALALHCTSCCEVKEVRGQCVGCEAEDSSNSRPQTRQQIRCGVRPVVFAPHWCAPLISAKGVGRVFVVPQALDFGGGQHQLHRNGMPTAESGNSRKARQQADAPEKTASCWKPLTVPLHTNSCCL